MRRRRRRRRRRTAGGGVERNMVTWDEASIGSSRSFRKSAASFRKSKPQSGARTGGCSASSLADVDVGVAAHEDDCRPRQGGAAREIIPSRTAAPMMYVPPLTAPVNSLYQRRRQEEAPSAVRRGDDGVAGRAPATSRRGHRRAPLNSQELNRSRDAKGRRNTPFAGWSAPFRRTGGAPRPRPRRRRHRAARQTAGQGRLPAPGADDSPPQPLPSLPRLAASRPVRSAEETERWRPSASSGRRALTG